MPISRTICILGALAASSGCVTHSPATNPNPLFEMPAAYAGEGGGADLAEPWWQAFDDPVLTDLIETALADNFTLAQGLIRINAAQGFKRQARAVRLPQVDFDASVERNWERLLDLDTSDEPTDLDRLESIVNQIYASAQEASDQSGGSLPGGNPGGGASIAEEIGAQQDEGENEQFDPTHWETQYGSGISFSWELDLWGRLRALARAQDENLESFIHEYEALRLFLSAEVADAYFQALEQRLQHDLLLEQRELAQTFLELLELRLLQGDASVVDVLQQRGQLAEIESEIPVVKAELGAQENRLDVLLGVPPDGRDRLANVDRALPDNTRLPAIGMPANLLHNRPDLRALQRQAVASDYEIAAAIAARLPQVTLTGSFSYSDVADQPALNGVGAASLLQPLLDWGFRKAAVEIARSNFRETLLAFSQAYLVAIEEVETSLWREARQRELIDALAKREDILRRTVEETRVRYSLGVTDYLPVLTALQDLQDIQRELIFERRALVSLRVQLYRAAGGATGLAPGDTLQMTEQAVTNQTDISQNSQNGQ